MGAGGLAFTGSAESTPPPESEGGGGGLGPILGIPPIGGEGSTTSRVLETLGSFGTNILFGLGGNADSALTRKQLAQQFIDTDPSSQQLQRLLNEQFGGERGGGQLFARALAEESLPRREQIVNTIASALGRPEAKILLDLLLGRGTTGSRQGLEQFVRVVLPEQFVSEFGQALPEVSPTEPLPQGPEPLGTLPGTPGPPGPPPAPGPPIRESVVNFLVSLLIHFLQLRQQQPGAEPSTTRAGQPPPIFVSVTGGPPGARGPLGPSGGGGGGTGMAHIDTSAPTGFGGVLQELIRVAGPVLGGLIPSPAVRINGGGNQPIVLPGGAGTMTPVRGLEIPFVDVVGQGVGTVTEPFRRTAAGAAAQPHLRVNPVNGRQEWFRPAGRPVLFSKDMGICRKVERLAKRAAKSTRSRRRTRKR